MLHMQFRTVDLQLRANQIVCVEDAPWSIKPIFSFGFFDLIWFDLKHF